MGHKIGHSQLACALWCAISAAHTIVAAPNAVRGFGRADEPIPRAERDLFPSKCRVAPYACGEERQASVRPSRLQQPPAEFRAFADVSAVSANAPDIFHIDDVPRHMSLAECEWREHDQHEQIMRGTAAT